MKVISVSWKISIYWLYYQKRILKIIHLGFHNVFLEFTFESIFDEVEDYFRDFNEATVWIPNSGRWGNYALSQNLESL